MESGAPRVHIGYMGPNSDGNNKTRERDYGVVVGEEDRKKDGVKVGGLHIPKHEVQTCTHCVVGDAAGVVCLGCVHPQHNEPTTLDNHTRTRPSRGDGPKLDFAS